VDLRKLRYFLAVAEDGTMTRAAEVLHIAQPVLTRQIRALEQELGVQLFERTAKGSELTPAGRQLADDAGPLLQAAVALEQRVRTAARGTLGLTVGFMPGIVVTAAVREYALRRPDVQVDVLRTSWADQADAVRNGMVDVSFVRSPFDRRDLDQLLLFEEPRLVALPATHELAERIDIQISELAHLSLLESPDLVPEWRDAAAELGSVQPPRPAFANMEEKLEHVATGRGMAIVPRSTAAYYRRPDVRYIPVTGIAPSTVSVVWTASRHSAEVDQFIEVAKMTVHALTLE
jgi:DNA-binding transcriptional LysR family regulator